MMQWNDVDYKTQRKILDMLEDLLLKQTNTDIQEAMVAAILELEAWSNRPCPVQYEDENGPYIAQAVDAVDPDWDN
jgi:hypothetical protein